MWRYWRALPPKGRIGILFGAWHTEPIVNRVARQDQRRPSSNSRWTKSCHFERMLADEGALILKFWFHLSKKAQKKRLKALASRSRRRAGASPTPTGSTSSSTTGFARSPKTRCAKRAPRDAPWIVVEGTDRELPLPDRRPHSARRVAEAPRRAASPPSASRRPLPECRARRPHACSPASTTTRALDRKEYDEASSRSIRAN